MFVASHKANNKVEKGVRSVGMGRQVAILDGVVMDVFNKKLILERSKRESYMDIWSRAVQKLRTTDTEAT